MSDERKDVESNVMDNNDIKGFSGIMSICNDYHTDIPVKKIFSQIDDNEKNANFAVEMSNHAFYKGVEATLGCLQFMINGHTPMNDKYYIVDENIDSLTKILSDYYQFKEEKAKEDLIKSGLVDDILIDGKLPDRETIVKILEKNGIDINNMS